MSTTVYIGAISYRNGYQYIRAKIRFGIGLHRNYTLTFQSEGIIITMAPVE